MAEIFFENFRVESFYTAAGGVLALYAAGKTTGVVIESGDGITHTMPVFEGFSIPHATIKLEFGGNDLTQYLA